MADELADGRDGGGATPRCAPARPCSWPVLSAQDLARRLAATAAAYDRLAPVLAPLMRVFEALLARPAVRALRLLLFELPPGRLLELGAGTGGRHLVALRPERRAGVVALDLSERSLRQLRLRRGRSLAVAGDAHRLPFAASVFDAVVACWVLESLADLDRGVLELYRVLRPEGEILLVACTEATDGGVRARLVEHMVRGSLGRPLPAQALRGLPGFLLISEITTHSGLFTVARLRAVAHGCCADQVPEPS